VGNPLTLSAHFDFLSQSIFSVTGEMLGVNTLKRLFGKLPDVNASPTTLTILAEYLGYKDWDTLEKIASNANSALQSLSRTTFLKDLAPGTRFRLTYAPNRKLHLEVLPDRRCLVLDREGAKVLPGDKLYIADITLGCALVANEVERDGVKIGRYEGGIDGGVQTVEIDED
jgi:hypothetical protein